MKVLDFLNGSSIILDLKSTTKADVISELSEAFKASGKISDVAKVAESLMEREKLGSTGIGQGVAIPHCKTANVSEMVGVLGVSKKGVQFEALDGEPVFILFVLVSPPEFAAQHLKVLARVSRLLKDKFFRQALKEAKTVESIQKTIQEEDEY